MRLAILLLTLSTIVAQAEEKTFSNTAIERMVIARTSQEYKNFRALNTEDMVKFRATRCPKTIQDEQISFSNWTAMNDAMGQPFPLAFMPRNPVERTRWVNAYWKMLGQKPTSLSQDAFIALAPFAKVMLIGVLDKEDCFVDLRAVTLDQFKRFREAAVVKEIEL
jgi:hypothetical protein